MNATGWSYDGRHYNVIAFSDVSSRDGYGWELEDVAPAPGRGTVYEAFLDNTTGEFTLTAFTSDPLPFELIQRFVTEAATGVPPAGT